MNALVDVRDIRKSYPGSRRGWGRATRNVVVDDVTFTIAPGETLAVVGESGAGKSTLGRLVLRLIEADAGTIRFEDQDLRSMSRGDLRRNRSKMQMIFQDPYSSLNPTITIGDAVAEPLLLHTSLRAEARRTRARELLHRVGIRGDQTDRYPYELSGGQLQRVSIARAIATDSRFVVCDEPVAALDVSIRAQVLNLLRDLQVERHLAYLFISHDLSLVAAIAHRVAVMYQGRIIEIGPTEEIFTRPQHPYTQRLLDAIPEPDPARRKLHLLPTVEPRTDHDGSWNGCAFYRRCPRAQDRCRIDTPLLHEGRRQAAVACHFVDEAADQASLANEGDSTLR